MCGARIPTLIAPVPAKQSLTARACDNLSITIASLPGQWKAPISETGRPSGVVMRGMRAPLEQRGFPPQGIPLLRALTMSDRLIPLPGREIGCAGRKPPSPRSDLAEATGCYIGYEARQYWLFSAVITTTPVSTLGGSGEMPAAFQSDTDLMNPLRTM